MSSAPDNPIADLGELLTDRARAAMAQAEDRSVHLFFDYRGPSFDVGGHGQTLSNIADALLDHAARRPDAQLVFFSVDVLPHREGRATVVLQVSCTLLPPSQRKDTGAGMVPGELARVRAWCESLDGSLAVGSLAKEGDVARADLLLACPPRPVDQTLATPHGTVAWLLGHPPLLFESIVRRLHRLGWDVELFRGVDDARAALAHESFKPPAAVVGLLKHGIPAHDLAALAGELPASTYVVLALHGPSYENTLDASTAVAGMARVLLPFSPRQLHELTQAALSRTSKVLSAPSTPVLALQRRPRALLAEDNLVNQLLCTEVLHTLGFEVEVANDGAEAISCCLAHPPDVVLMDLHMPVMTGLDAARRLRELAREGRVPLMPIIAVTARSEDEMGQEAAKAGIDGFVEKPLDIGVLKRELQRLLPDVDGCHWSR